MPIQQILARTLAALALCLGLATPLKALATANPWEGVETFIDPFKASDNITRTVAYLRPPSGGAGRPVVFMLHYNQGGYQPMANLTDAGQLARDYDVWVVLPISEDLTWSISPNVANQPDHVAFLSELIDYAIPKYGMDAKRVYMFGYSQGANMTVRFACEKPGKIAAGAAVSSTMLRALTTGGHCDPAQGTPMLFMDGTKDDQIRYNGTLVGACTLNNTCAISAKNAVEYWANLNKCTGAAAHSDLPNIVNDDTNVTLDTYGTCDPSGSASIDDKKSASDADTPRAQLYTVVNGGHVWPGALDFTPRDGLTTQDIKAGPAIWENFFSKFRLP